MTGAAAVTGAGRTPRASRTAPTVRAIHASPAAVGCRPPSACGNAHRPASGSITITSRPAAVPAATMSLSVRRSAGEPGGAAAKVVSSAIRAAGAAARTWSTAARTRWRSSPDGVAASSWPACTITSAGPSPGSPSWSSMRDTGPRPPEPARL